MLESCSLFKAKLACPRPTKTLSNVKTRLPMALQNSLWEQLLFKSLNVFNSINCHRITRLYEWRWFFIPWIEWMTWRLERWLAWINMGTNTMKKKSTPSLVSDADVFKSVGEFSHISIYILVSLWSINRQILNCFCFFVVRKRLVKCVICAQDVTAGWSTQQRWTGRKPCGMWMAVWFQLNGKFWAITEVLKRSNMGKRSHLFLNRFWNTKLIHY